MMEVKDSSGERQQSDLTHTVIPLSYRRSSEDSNLSSSLSTDQVAISINCTKDTKDAEIDSVLQNEKQSGFINMFLQDSHIKENSIKLAVVILFHIYLLYATYFNYANGNQWNFCEGLGFLLILVAFGYVYMVLSVITKRFNKYFLKVEVKYQNMYASRPWIEKITYIAVIVAIIVFLAFDTKNDRRRLLSAAGIIALVLVAFIFSKHRLKINWRQVTWGLVLQFIFGLGILRWKPGRLFFECIGKKVDAFLSFTDKGSSFIYGPLISRKPFLPHLLPNDSLAFNVTSLINEKQAAPAIVVFKALSVIYFFSFVINMLFYLGYVQNITLKIGFLLRKTIGTSTVESVSAAANIFLGQAMTPLLVAPYIKDLTLSELHAVITGGFATIAGTTMAAYIR